MTIDVDLGGKATKQTNKIKKHFLSRALEAPFWWNRLICGRRHHEEQFCNITLITDQWSRKRCRLKIFLIWRSGSPIVQQSGTICAMLVAGIKRNNFVKLF